MTNPIILKLMWLLLASAASAGLDTRRVQREFPQLAHVIYSICGLSDLDISISHPCAFSIFGMAYAFTECATVHHDDYENFQPCVLSCTTDDRCARACADPEVRNEHCLANCQVVAGCIKEVSKHPKIKGHVSAKDELMQCMTEKPPAPPPPNIIIPSSPAAAAPPAAALLATKFAPAPAPIVAASPAMSPAPAAGDTFSMRKGTIRGRRGLVDPRCVCSKTGIIHGTDTGQPGCAKHGKERNAFVEAYCYIEGGFECGGAMSSDIYEGLFWVGCEKPNLAVLYPPKCEILQENQVKLFPVPADLGLKAPPETVDDLQADMDPVPTEGNPMERLQKNVLGWNQPMHPMWHASHGNAFAKGAFQSGPVVPTSGVTNVAMGPAPAAALTEEHATISRLRGVQQH